MTLAILGGFGWMTLFILSSVHVCKTPFMRTTICKPQGAARESLPRLKSCGLRWVYQTQLTVFYYESMLKVKRKIYVIQRVNR